VLDILIHIEIIIKSVLHSFCSVVYLCLDYFTFSESGNFTKRDLFYTNIERFGIYYIRRCSESASPDKSLRPRRIHGVDHLQNRHLHRAPPVEAQTSVSSCRTNTPTCSVSAFVVREEYLLQDICRSAGLC